MSLLHARCHRGNTPAQPVQSPGDMTKSTTGWLQRWRRTLLPAIVVLSWLATPIAVADNPPPANTCGSFLGSSIGGGIVQTLLVHRSELSSFAATVTRSATRSAIEESGPELGEAITKDLASDGTVSHAITGMTALGVQAAIDASAQRVRVGLVEVCGAIPTGECIRSYVRATSQQAAGGVIDSSSSDGPWPFWLSRSSCFCSPRRL